MQRLLLATHNIGKMEELKDLLLDVPVELVVPTDIDSDYTVQEIGENYAENAALKASAWARRTGLWTLGDDSGLEVAVLDGAPGIRSARLVGEGRTDEDRRAALLDLLRDKPLPWTARFVSAVALSSPAGQLDLVEGVCEGRIIELERGSQGFGYDPIFLVEGLGLTMAELDMGVKNQLSHRAIAMMKIIPLIHNRLGLQPMV